MVVTAPVGDVIEVRSVPEYPKVVVFPFASWNAVTFPDPLS
jgi:hypothetical protein